MVLAAAVPGTVIAAATNPGTANSLAGNFVFLLKPVVFIVISKTNNWERTFSEARYLQPALVTGRYCSKKTC